MRIPLPCSIPFVPLKRMASEFRPAACRRLATERNATEGVTKTIKSAPTQSAMSLVTRTESGTLTPGRYSWFSRVSRRVAVRLGVVAPKRDRSFRASPREQRAPFPNLLRPRWRCVRILTFG